MPYPFVFDELIYIFIGNIKTHNMKKQILIALLAMGLLAPAVSFGQDKPVTKGAIKKEGKMDKKESKGKTTKAVKKGDKMDTKAAKGK
jgi:hypothetical protein